MKVTVLGSGSSGNSILVESSGVRLLVDAGFSGRDLERRLDEVEVQPDTIDALLITHDHTDHSHGMGIVARRWGIPLYLSEATQNACAKLLNGSESVHRFERAVPLFIGDLRIDPFLTVHDAVDPVAVTVTEVETGHKLGVATDLGRPTQAVRHELRMCDVLVLESNHDEVMLHDSPYPWSVKARIASSHGHLSNRAAAELACEIYHDGLGAVVLAHLSAQANDPDLAFEVVGNALEKLGYRGELSVARQDRPIPTIEVEQLRSRLEPPQLALL